VTTSVDGVSDEACRTKRRVVTRGHNIGATRRRHSANVRERSRMRSINAAFDRLRALLPPTAGSRPTDGGQRAGCRRDYGPSKVETLRMAVAYIGCLTRLVNAADRRHSISLLPRVGLDSGPVSSLVIIDAQLQPTGHYYGQSCWLTAQPHVSF